MAANLHDSCPLLFHTVRLGFASSGKKARKIPWIETYNGLANEGPDGVLIYGVTIPILGTQAHNGFWLVCVCEWDRQTFAPFEMVKSLSEKLMTSFLGFPSISYKEEEELFEIPSSSLLLQRRRSRGSFLLCQDLRHSSSSSPCERVFQ